MRSYLFFIPQKSADTDKILACLQNSPISSALTDLYLIAELQVDADYSAQAISSILSGKIGTPCAAPTQIKDVRVLPLSEQADHDAMMLLAAAGIDAAVIRRTLLVLCGIDDAQYRLARDILTAKSKETAPPPRKLPDDAGEGFLHLFPDELTARAARLDLALPLSCLSVIADYYRTVELRDPSPDELLLLDEAYRAAAADPAQCAPIEFTTDDPRCEAAYADLMAKRRAIYPNASAPATLSELSGLASAYFSAQYGKCTPARHTVLAHPDTAPLLLAAQAGNARIGFADHTGDNASLYSTDPIIPHLPKPEDRLLFLPAVSIDALKRLFESPAAPYIRRSLPVPPHGLIAVLGEVLADSGLGLRFSLPDGQSLSAYLQNETFGVLLVAMPNGSRNVPNALRAAGLPFRLIAAVQKDPFCVLPNAAVRFPAAMLSPRPAITAQSMMPPTAQPSPTELGLLLPYALSTADARHMDGFNFFTAHTVGQYPVSTVSTPQRTITAADCIPSTDPFGEIRDTALSLISRLLCAGATLRDITLAMTLEAPFSHADSTAAGSVIAAILAVHTVQTEFGLLGEPPVLRNGTALCVRLGVSASVQTPSAPSLAPGQQLWLAAPRSTHPHLDGELAVFSAAENLCAAAQAAIPTEKLPPAAAAVRTALRAGLSVDLTADDQTLITPVPGGILFALPAPPPATAKIAWTAIGTLHPLTRHAATTQDHVWSIEQIISSMRGDLPAPMLPLPKEETLPRISAHTVKHPRVLIPYTENTPLALAQTVEALGGEPISCPIKLSNAAEARQSLSSLSEEIARSQIVLVGCSHICTLALLSHRRVAEALAQLRANDGLICAWEGAFAACLSLGLFSPTGEGIDWAPLRSQRMLCSSICQTSSPWTASVPQGWRETVLLAADPLCPLLSPEDQRSLALAGQVAACAVGTPDGCPAITALLSPDDSILGLSAPPSTTYLSRAIAYFT